MTNNTVKNTSKNKKSSNTAGWFLIGISIVLIMGILAFAFEGLRDNTPIGYIFIVISPVFLLLLAYFVFSIWIGDIRFRKAPKKKKHFDADMEAQSPHWYDDGFEEVYFMEDYQMAKTTDAERRKMVSDYAKYWNGFKKYLSKQDARFFDKGIERIKNISLKNFDYPNMHITFMGKNGHDVELKLSAYNRLFAEIKIDKLTPEYVPVVRGYLSRYIDNWDAGYKLPLRGYGKNLHLYWRDNGILYLCTTYNEHGNSGDITNTDTEYKWLYRMVKIAKDIANEKRHDFDTYSPAEYRKYLKDLKLEGRTITGVMNTNAILEYDKMCRYIEMDGDFALSFDDGRIVGFSFDCASHPAINVLDSWDALEKQSAKDHNTGLKNSEIFGRIVGMKITHVVVDSSNDINEGGAGYWDEGFDENKGDFIVRLQLVLDDAEMLEIEPGDDWTNVSLNPYV